MSRFLVGLSVKISRSDGEKRSASRLNGASNAFTQPFWSRRTGRVHSATVTSANGEKSTAMVEWYERKICRGKEVGGNWLHTTPSSLLTSSRLMRSRSRWPSYVPLIRSCWTTSTRCWAPLRPPPVLPLTRSVLGPCCHE